MCKNASLAPRFVLKRRQAQGLAAGGAPGPPRCPLAWPLQCSERRRAFWRGELGAALPARALPARRQARHCRSPPAWVPAATGRCARRPSRRRARPAARGAARRAAGARRRRASRGGGRRAGAPPPAGGGKPAPPPPPPRRPESCLTEIRGTDKRTRASRPGCLPPRGARAGGDGASPRPGCALAGPGLRRCRGSRAATRAGRGRRPRGGPRSRRRRRAGRGRGGCGRRPCDRRPPRGRAPAGAPPGADSGADGGRGAPWGRGRHLHPAGRCAPAAGSSAPAPTTSAHSASSACPAPIPVPDPL
jgi:hypothetical protein